MPQKGGSMKRKVIKINREQITFDRGVDEFITRQKARNLRPATIKFYENTVLTLYKFIEPKTPVSTITINTVNNFIMYCKNELSVCDYTVSTYVKGLRAILYYFMEEEYMESFKIRLPKSDTPVIETYTDIELEKLLVAPTKKSSFAEYRNWTIVNFLLGTGCRCSNILNLRVKDIDLDNMLVTFTTSKNRTPYIVPLSENLTLILKKYIRVRGGKDTDYLFCSVYGEKMIRNSLNNAIRTYNKSRGVERTSIHAFRHTFAKKFILNGGGAFQLMKLLNHRDITITKHYVELFTNDLKRGYNELNPLESMLKQTKRIKMR
ncbi:site-specific integrase [Clostridium sp.]|uniref:tyrosine-type recombinase/integrase n=1 Tax=Clostridium sp. TaxID=1506 RepID=UPI00257C4DD6|nr:site-specific integrase [Clostridium sp.]